ncbi:MAG: hypothetical protein P8J87_01865, partial [Verrucomicrobiales bacterium]|nr:hypothetical protein [Verrucomicrobiales bacterium]
FTPAAAGMRSPCGLGANTRGDMFCVDQQGNWIPTTPIYHLQPGAFDLNPDGLGPTFKLSTKLPNKLPYPEAVAAVPEMVPPAVWLPYNKVGRSGTDLAVCDQADKFGPFDGQFIVAEFTDAKLSRVFLEKVDGHYQGAAFPFLSGFASGIVRLRFAPDGSLMVGMTSRGWSSLGTRAYGLQRVTYDPATPPFAIKEMRARPDGFQLTFTQPIDPTTATDPANYTISSYTYLYSNAYGSPEINNRPNPVTAAQLSPDHLSVHLSVQNLRPLHVHQLHAPKITTPTGQKLSTPHAYYTLNRIPKP